MINDLMAEGEGVYMPLPNPYKHWGLIAYCPIVLLIVLAQCAV